jgi:hypothetical protein
MTKADAPVLMGVAVFCFFGFAYALFTLAQVSPA